ncbi:hypothetical protein N8343_08340 [Akkermansiaceae bacterium]|nr:hypothetical protein [Akkermansiaceae bacterium]
MRLGDAIPLPEDVIDLTNDSDSDDEVCDNTITIISDDDVANDAEMSMSAPTYAAMVKRGEHTCMVSDDSCNACVVRMAEQELGNLDSDSD